MNSKQSLYASLTAGALMLSLNGVGAQGVLASDSSLSNGLSTRATRVKSPSPTPQTTNRAKNAARYNALTQNNVYAQNRSVFGGANGIAAYPSGMLNSGYGYGFYGLGGSTSPAASAAYFGYGQPTAFGGYPYGYAVNNINGIGSVYAGNSISIVDSPLAGGFAVVNPNGAYFVGPNGQPAEPALANGGNITSNDGRSGGITRFPNRNANSQNGQGAASSAVSNTDTSAPISLQQLIAARQDANFNLRIGWLGDPAMIDAMNVTLLNQYHLPLTSNTASNGKPVTFAADRNVYAARYYRVDIQFADGAVATMTGRIKR